MAKQCLYCTVCMYIWRCAGDIERRKWQSYKQGAGYVVGRHADVRCKKSRGGYWNQRLEPTIRDGKYWYVKKIYGVIVEIVLTPSPASIYKVLWQCWVTLLVVIRLIGGWFPSSYLSLLKCAHSSRRIRITAFFCAPLLLPQRRGGRAGAKHFIMYSIQRFWDGMFFSFPYISLLLVASNVHKHINPTEVGPPLLSRTYQFFLLSC